jgi:hypothetical protein
VSLGERDRLRDRLRLDGRKRQARVGAQQLQGARAVHIPYLDSFQMGSTSNAPGLSRRGQMSPTEAATPKRA